MLVAVLPAAARHKSDAWARNQFSTAERMREALSGRPAGERTRRDYERAINAYRRVYLGAPTSTKADPSVVASAELMVEMGRRFNDDDALRSAIKEYGFLRREYPGSRYRFEALFTIGEIYKDDLTDSRQAQQAFEEFLRRYPRHHLADQARSELEDMAQLARKQADRKKVRASRQAEEKSDATAADANLGPPAAAKPTRVTGIRHWSTPDYTRVAIDLEDDVQFESQRIEHPNRIFFDLFDTKLASTLVGKSFDVDDGFLKKIRVSQYAASRSRVVFEVDDVLDYNAFLLSNPTRLIIDIRGKQAAKAKPFGPMPGDATDADTGTKQPTQDTSAQIATVHTEAGPKKVIVEADNEDEDAPNLEAPEIKPVTKRSPEPLTPVPPARRAGKSKLPPRPAIDVREAQPTASGDRSLIRALGLKIGKIVIDPGHGGHDTGTIGPNGLQEKDLVLEVARRLGKLLETRLGAEVVYTRSDDTFIPLETRTAIANQQQADLFVSVHANSSHDPDARGVETYYLNFTSSREALDVAARENAASDKSVHELQDLVKKIALKEKIEESREFATDVQHALHTGLSARNPGLRDRGVKKAPFVVLIGANMPSILAEISFVSNPADERRLETGEYRQRIAESLYRGISKYASGLSGVKVASKIDKSEGQ